MIEQRLGLLIAATHFKIVSHDEDDINIIGRWLRGNIAPEDDTA
jgi:hypothetical protein